MRVAHGTVIDGKVVLDEPTLAEGESVVVFARDGDADAAPLSEDELAELVEGLRQADAGELIPGEAFLDRLRRC